MRVCLFNTELHIEWRIHALQQMISRNISRDEIFEILNSGEIIESYPEDIPYPNYLIAGDSHGRPIHVVIGYAKDNITVFVITAYEPDNEKWENNFRRRK